MRLYCTYVLLLLVCLATYRTNSFLITHNRRISSSGKTREVALKAKKFDDSNFVSVSLIKPLGLSLEEVEENKARGVTISAVNDGGSAKESGKVTKGLFLVSANGIDLKYKTFDDIIDVFSKVPDGGKLNLVFIEPRNVFKGPAVISVKLPNGKDMVLNSLKGLTLRTVLQSAGVDVYSGKSKLTNCGGGGQCGTCAVLVSDNADWEMRAGFEAARLKKYDSTARLSCTTTIEGDCTVKVLAP